MDIIEDSRPDFLAIDDFVSRPLVFLLGRGEAYLAKVTSTGLGRR